LLALPAPLLDAQPAYAVATTFTVSTAEDSDDASCSPPPNGDCTLREAINAANNNDGRDIIAFNIPGDGVHTITPATPLPPMTDAAVIDGYTQPGTRINTATQGTNAVLRIEIDGRQIDSQDSGLHDAHGQGTVFRGLVINNFKRGAGITVWAGVGLEPTVVEGNFLGVDPSGTTAKANYTGVTGVFTTGTGAASIRIGGATPAARNLLSGNEFGIALGSIGYTVVGNLIGTDRSGVNPLANKFGISVIRGLGTIRENVIAFNARFGVYFPFDSGNAHRIDRNAIFANGGIGIELSDDGRTPNDPGDGDDGPNGFQNYPVLTAATTSPGGGTTITGTLDTQPGDYLLQFFANANAADAEGQTFLGERQVSTGQSGDAAFTFTVDQRLGGQAITATATNVTVFQSVDTSEFSAPVTVPRPTPPAPDPQAGVGNQTPSSQNDNQGQTKQNKKKKKKGKKGKRGKKNRKRISTRTNGTPEVTAKSRNEAGDKRGKQTDDKRHGRHGRKSR
jgi:CSLREA domain-containing protein